MIKIIAAMIIFIITFKCEAQKKVEWRGCYVGTQVLYPIQFNKKLVASPATYLIALAGIKKFTFNTQLIVPFNLKKNVPLIKFGLDYKLF